MPKSPVAIVVGAGRGMGAASARELASRGWQLALFSPSGAAEKLANELGQLGVTGSNTEPGDLEALVQKTLARYGRVDGVVNSTGHPPGGPLLEIADADWHRALDMIILSVTRIARLVTPVMEKQRSGAFVNISTFAAFEPDAAYPTSSVMRAGLGALAKLFADRYASVGIRMNNLLPGFIDSYPETKAATDRIPMGRFGRVAEVAKTVAFLISEDSSYIAGQNLRVDGGITRSV